MNATLEAPEAVEADIGHLPPCTSPNHEKGAHGHVAGQPAAFLVGAPCGMTWFACVGWVAKATGHISIQCETCGAHPTRAHTFVPLGDMGIA